MNTKPIGSRAPMKDAGLELRIFRARMFVAGLIITLACAALVGRLIQLQILEHEQYRALSADNSLRVAPLAPTRGLIYDRNGVVLADNRPVWQLELIPEQVIDVAGTLERLHAAGFIDADDRSAIGERLRRSQRFQSVTLRSQLSDQEVARFAVQRPRFPGVTIEARLIRHYPHGPLAVHAIGYVGGLSADDLAGLDAPEQYAATKQIGKVGIEQHYEATLHGQIGHHQLLTTAHGRTLEKIPGAQPVPGENIWLTLDINLQRVAEEALTGVRGAIVALEPSTGEILALVSTPGFDPNAFATGLKQAEFSALTNDLDRPLFDRTLRGRYPPGSTIKPILALAALETHVTSLEHRIFCRGAYSLPGSSHRYRDWKPEGHGLVDIHDAIAESCDVFFYELASELDIDRMHDYLTRFGLGEITGIDITGEKAGLVPSRAWKRSAFSRRQDQSWFPGETVIASIGQGYLLATPLQLAHATATLGLRGRRFQPHIVQQRGGSVDADVTVTEPIELPSVELENPVHWEAVVNAMRDVMQGENGTARQSGMNAPYTMAGKSGTAQVFSVAQEEEYDEDELDERLRDHALFVAFAPLENPQIAIAVVIENGSSGSRVAAPVARRIMDYWLVDRPAVQSAERLP